MKRKLSKAEAGKLGANKSRITAANQKKDRIARYLLSPVHCKECNTVLDYNSRRKSFCGHSCSAKYNNKKKRIIVTWSCKACNKEHNTLNYKVKQYCNQTCKSNADRQATFQKLLDGKLVWRDMIRNALIWKFGRTCSGCGQSEWQGHPIPIEVDHIDGNAGNNKYENLRLLCPNCHGITVTWKGKNKGNGRAARGLRLS